MVPALETPPQPRAGLVSVDGRTYPLESARLITRAEGGLALSRLTQAFANPHDQALEVVYTMALPADGAVLGYTVRVGERVIRGVVEPREKAEAAYTRALAEGRTAGLLEQDRDDTFQQRLGNIPPGTKVEVEIEVLQRLACLAAIDSLGPQWEYRFPTVVGVRYEGAPGVVPDAGRLDVDRDGDGAIPARIELELTVADPTANQISSPSHTVLCDAGPDGVRARFGTGERLDRDLVVRWPACAAESGARLLIGGGLAGDDGRYGLVTITPPAAPRATLARDLTVLIDASGSMDGPPLEHAKQVVTELLRSLEAGDRFELLAFANSMERLTPAMTGATPDAVARAQAALRALQAGGGTEMASAMQEALKPLRHDSQRQVVLVTDGYIGFENQVVAHIMHKLPEGSRVHAVGIGSAPNRSLTAPVARAGRGVELLVGDAVAARDAARRLCAASARPVITEVSIGGSALLRPATRRLRDVFAGQPLLAAVELGRQGGTLEVSGRLAGAAEPWVRRIEVPAEAAQTAAVVTPHPLGALFGREAIADLELTLAAAEQGRGEVEEKIEALGMRHRITSRRTSLVAIAEEPGVDPAAPKRVERIAVEVPAGVSAEGSGLLGGGVMLYRGIVMSPRASLARMSRSAFRLAQDYLAYSLKAPVGWDAARLLLSELGVPKRDVSDSLERLRHELEGLPPAIVERLARIRVAAEELTNVLAGERERFEQLSQALNSAVADKKLRKQADELLRRLQAHTDEMRELAERVARAAREWERSPLGADARLDDLVRALGALTHGDFARNRKTLVDELGTLLTRGVPGGV